MDCGVWCPFRFGALFFAQVEMKVLDMQVKLEAPRTAKLSPTLLG